MSGAEPSPEPAPGPARGGLGQRARVRRGSFYELAGYGIQQVVRLGSNLILTRLLAPSAFGLSALVATIFTGLYLLSDLAIQPCVIRSKRGDEPDFLNTAFTIQAVRGGVLALIMILLAKPASWFYHEPQLEKLIYLGSLQLVIGGLHSTAVFTMRRSLRLGRVNALELGQNLVSTTIMIVLARAGFGVWALLIGAICGTLFFTISSHFLPVPYRNRFHFDREASKEITHFGRWILGGTAATFFGGQADRLLMVRLLNATWLGVYTIAINLSEAAGAIINRLVNGVMYPLLSEAVRGPEGAVADLYYRLRRRLDVLSMTGTGLLAGAGAWIIHTLWSKQYAEAGWILRVLCFRVAVSLLVGPADICLVALGQTRYGFQRSVTRLVGVLVLIPVGWYVGGMRGLVWGTVIAEAFTLLAVWPKLRELGILRVRRELLSMGMFAASFAVGAAILPWLPQLHVR